MTQEITNLIKGLKNKNVLKFGEFTLRSGIKSNYYCDIKEALGDPDLLLKMASGLIRIVPRNTTCIAGAGYGGITLASLVSYRLKLPLTLVRNEAKNYGTKKIIDGYLPNNKDKICIVDDVFTTGSSIEDIKEKLATTKAKFARPVVVLNRSNDKKIISLLKDKDIFMQS